MITILALGVAGFFVVLGAKTRRFNDEHRTRRPPPRAVVVREKS